MERFLLRGMIAVVALAVGGVQMAFGGPLHKHANKGLYDPCPCACPCVPGPPPLPPQVAQPGHKCLHHHCKHGCLKGGCSGCSECQQCPAAQPCQQCPPCQPCQGAYDEQQQTLYKTVYEDVMEKKKVQVTKYVEETQYHCVESIVMKPQTPAPCGPAANACAPAACQQMVPERVCLKVPYTTMRPVTVEEEVERPTVVAKQVPYTVTVCVPRPQACGPVAPCAPAR